MEKFSIPSAPKYLVTKNGRIFDEDGNALKIYLKEDSAKFYVRLFSPKTNKRTDRYIHSIVAETFLDARLGKSHNCIFLDGDSLNPALDNIGLIPNAHGGPRSNKKNNKQDEPYFHETKYHL